jgi:hypothetical protein
MRVILRQRLASVSFAFIVLLSAPSIGAQARPRCVADNMTVGGLAGRTTTSLPIAQYRFDVVPCSEEERDRPVTGSKSSVEATEQAAALMAWIVTQTHWTVYSTPPIRLIPPAEIKAMFAGEKPTDFNIESIYSNKDHIVYLSDRWNPNALRDRSALLHELVHHLQYLNEVKAACPQEYEWQAYQLQAEWLHEQGVEDPLKLIGVNPLFIYMLAHCPEF